MPIGQTYYVSKQKITIAFLFEAYVIEILSIKTIKENWAKNKMSKSRN
ncbi:hypothetical protein C2W64_02321 [Brevibacillus laterosporus]|nr:hypothetical protein C2W64_02321 [Brevibacillus laterosporus]